MSGCLCTEVGCGSSVGLTLLVPPGRTERSWPGRGARRRLSHARRERADTTEPALYDISLFVQ